MQHAASPESTNAITCPTACPGFRSRYQIRHIDPQGQLIKLRASQRTWDTLSNPDGSVRIRSAVFFLLHPECPPMARRFHNHRKESGSLLAAVFITALGVGCCLFVVSAMSPASFSAAAWSLGGLLTVVFTLIVLFRYGRSPGTDSGFLLLSSRSRRDDGLGDYEPRVANQSTLSSATGTNRPISAKEVHEIQVTSANTWVPASSGRRRKNSQS